MAYFEWADDMVIDQGPIDADHLKLVNLVNELHSATSDGSGQVVVARILDALIEYTNSHLEREEVLMDSLGFPNLAEHKQGHARFIGELRSLQEKYHGGSITVAAQLSAVLRDWLSLHIRRDDKEILRFMKNRAKRRQRLQSVR